MGKQRIPSLSLAYSFAEKDGPISRLFGSGRHLYPRLGEKEIIANMPTLHFNPHHK